MHPSSCQVFIADTDNHRIQVLNNDFTYSHEFGRKGSGNGQFNAPVDVACDYHGNVYIADTWNNRVQVLTSSGQFIDTLSTDTCTLQYPTGIAIDSMNTVYVGGSSSVLSSVILVFNSKRQFIKCLDSDFTLFSRQSLQGIAVDYTGNLLRALPSEGAVAIY